MGEGVYTIASTKDYRYPVHYFRGEVFDNNVKFANFCWKIVRTTTTGGVKLVYNGTPNENGQCVSTTEASTLIGTSAFNSSNTSLADVGYMYMPGYSRLSATLGANNWYNYVGKTSNSHRFSLHWDKYCYGDDITYSNSYYRISDLKCVEVTEGDYGNNQALRGKYVCWNDGGSGLTTSLCTNVSYIYSTDNLYAHYVSLSLGETYESLIEQANNIKWIYGKDVTYVDGTYKLVDSVEASPMDWGEDYKTFVNAHHYTCQTTSDSCTAVKYIYDVSPTGAYYMTLRDGKKIEDILKEMTTGSSNSTNSTIKATIGDWYRENMNQYTNLLEDTVWCNDRSIYQKGGWDKNSTTVTDLYFGGRGRNFESYKPSIECPNANDRFTVSSSKGNGKLLYPVALLTADELTLAGHGKSGYSKSSYLYNGQDWWTLTPDASGVSMLGVSSNGGLISMEGNKVYGIRPSISLSHKTMISGGDGTGETPYEILQNANTNVNDSIS